MTHGWITVQKRTQMFEKCLNKKKEVKIVRRIVFVVALVLIIGGLIGGRAVYKYISEALTTGRPGFGRSD